MYLMEKDSVVQDDGPTAVDRNLKDENNKRISRGECDILLQQLTVEPAGQEEGGGVTWGQILASSGAGEGSTTQQDIDMYNSAGGI